MLFLLLTNMFEPSQVVSDEMAVAAASTGNNHQSFCVGLSREHVCISFTTDFTRVLYSHACLYSSEFWSTALSGIHIAFIVVHLTLIDVVCSQTICGVTGVSSLVKQYWWNFSRKTTVNISELSHIPDTMIVVFLNAVTDGVSRLESCVRSNWHESQSVFRHRKLPCWTSTIAPWQIDTTSKSSRYARNTWNQTCCHFLALASSGPASLVVLENGTRPTCWKQWESFPFVRGAYSGFPTETTLFRCVPKTSRVHRLCELLVIISF